MSTAVSSPSRANFRIFLTYFFPSQCFFVDAIWLFYLWMNINFNLCSLQASCRHAAGQAKVQPLVLNHTSWIEKCRNIFVQRRELSLVIATVKTSPVIKVAWQGHSYNWGTQRVKSWGHAEKVMFSRHDLKTLLFFSMTPWLYPLCTPIICYF